MGRLGYLGIILALVATTAVAQDRPPPTAAQIAAAKAEADALIAKAAVADLFTNVTTGDSLEIKHKASNLNCGFDPGVAANEIRVLPGLPRGDDVVCHTTIIDFDELVHISKPARTVRLNDAFRAAVTEFRQAHPDAKPYDGAVAQLGDGPRGAPAHQSSNLVYKDSAGKPQYLFIGMSIVRGWTVDVRVTGPQELATVGSLLGEVTLMATAAPD